MKKLLLTLFIILSAFDASAGPEHDHDEHQEREQHYKAKMPESKAQAMHNINKGVKKIEQELIKNNLEAIHKETYSIEAAVEFLNKNEKGIDTKEFSQILEVIHKASEHNEKAKITASLPDLKGFLKDLN